MSTSAAVGMIDHLVVVAPNLAEAISHWRTTTGTTPVDGGSHEGMGTINALVGLDMGRYVEIVAPDPWATATADTEQARTLPGPVLHTFAVYADDLEVMAAELADSGLSLDIVELTRRTPDGDQIAFRYAPVRGHDLGLAVPFFIEWGATPHPSSHLEPLCSLVEATISHPNLSELDRLLKRLGITGITTMEGNAPELTAAIETPAGPRVLQSLPTLVTS